MGLSSETQPEKWWGDSAEPLIVMFLNRAKFLSTDKMVMPSAAPQYIHPETSLTTKRMKNYFFLSKAILWVLLLDPFTLFYDYWACRTFVVVSRDTTQYPVESSCALRQMHDLWFCQDHEVHYSTGVLRLWLMQHIAQSFTVIFAFHNMFMLQTETNFSAFAFTNDI